MAGDREIVFGVIGTGWIVRAHVHALHTLNHLGPLASRIQLKRISGRRVGEPLSVIGSAKSILSDADDTFPDGLEMPGGATASPEASSCATGWKSRHRIEVNGTEGSAWWDMEQFNRLHVMFVADRRQGVGGLRDVLVTEQSHPFMADWWEAGWVIGWQSTFVHQWRAFLRSVLAAEWTDPLQATFHDGVRANELGDAVLRSAQEGRRLALAPEPAGVGR